ncbi:hypothetical protein PTTG_11356, partial [Puccinia triticina 1-1 BBBD Race 1]
PRDFLASGFGDTTVLPRLCFLPEINQVPRKRPLAAYPNQHIYTPHPHGPSQGVAVVGNIHRGIGRVVLGELVAQKFIVIALVDKPNNQWPWPAIPSVQELPLLPSRCPAQEIVRRKTTQLSSATRGSLLESTTELSSRPSLLCHTSTVFEAAWTRTIVELKNIFYPCRFNTFICSFKPQTLDPPQGPRAKARTEDEQQFGLPLGAERARIKRMEHTILNALLCPKKKLKCMVSLTHPSTVGVFTVTKHLSATISQQSGGILP